MTDAAAGSGALEEGDVVSGVVAAIADAVVLEVGGRRCVVGFAEFGGTSPAVGDRVEVFVDRLEPLIVSKDKADKLRLHDSLLAAAGSGAPVRGEVIAAVKGGVIVDVGTRAFMPASQADLRPVTDLGTLVGQVFEVKVVEFKPRRGTVVVSRRALLEAERALKRDEVMKTLAPGVVVEGTVKAIVAYGAFIDLGGVDGLVRNEDLSWSHVAHPSQVVDVGDPLRVQVLDLGGDKGKVALGVKQLTADPWLDVPRRYQPGKRVEGKVLRITDFGAFVELEPHVEGLVHVSEMSWSKRQRHPRELVQKGRVIDVLILGVEADKRRIALGMRQLVPNPWKQLRETHKVGDVVRGPVRSVTDFGVFVEIADGVDGLVHAADMSWTERVRPADRYRVGEPVEAVLLDIDVEAERVALGVKQLTEDPWRALARVHPPGSRLRGKVARLVDFGAFIALEGGIDGLLHVSEMDADRPEDVVQLGQEIEVVVLDIDVEAGRVALSLRGPQRPQRGAGPKGSTGSFSNTTMADKLARLKSKG